VTALGGDFNGDGKGDIALVGGVTATSAPIALSHGDGTFDVIAGPSADFANVAKGAAVRPVAGDYNGDGRSDIALLGPTNTVYVALTGANAASFDESNKVSPDLTSWAQEDNTKLISGY
jgi:hypothetical protein